MNVIPSYPFLTGSNESYSDIDKEDRGNPDQLTQRIGEKRTTVSEGPSTSDSPEIKKRKDDEKVEDFIIEEFLSKNTKLEQVLQKGSFFRNFFEKKPMHINTIDPSISFINHENFLPFIQRTLSIKNEAMPEIISAYKEILISLDKKNPFSPHCHGTPSGLNQTSSPYSNWKIYAERELTHPLLKHARQNLCNKESILSLCAQIMICHALSDYLLPIKCHATSEENHFLFFLKKSCLSLIEEILKKIDLRCNEIIENSIPGNPKLEDYNSWEKLNIDLIEEISSKLFLDINFIIHKELMSKDIIFDIRSESFKNSSVEELNHLSHSFFKPIVHLANKLVKSKFCNKNNIELDRMLEKNKREERGTGHLSFRRSIPNPETLKNLLEAIFLPSNSSIEYLIEGCFVEKDFLLKIDDTLIPNQSSSDGSSSFFQRSNSIKKLAKKITEEENLLSRRVIEKNLNKNGYISFESWKEMILKKIRTYLDKSNIKTGTEFSFSKTPYFLEEVAFSYISRHIIPVFCKTDRVKKIDYFLRCSVIETLLSSRVITKRKLIDAFFTKMYDYINKSVSLPNYKEWKEENIDVISYHKFSIKESIIEELTSFEHKKALFDPFEKKIIVADSLKRTALIRHASELISENFETFIRGLYEIIHREFMK